MVRAGMKEQVLSSASTFYCVSCYECYVRCPKGIKPTNLIHAVQTIAEREGYHPPTNTLLLYRVLRNQIRAGRPWELGMMIRYYLRNNPLSAFGDIPVAIALLTHGRLPLRRPKQAKGGWQVRKMIETVRSTGGGAQ